MKVKINLKSLLKFAVIAATVAYIFAPAPIKEKIARRFIASDFSRSPASIQKVFDFSYLQGQALLVASRERLINSLDIKPSDDKSTQTITLGNFVISNEHNEREFACGFYDRVSLTFEAEGISVNGEKPRLVMDTGCEVGDNINNLIPLELPVSKITGQAPSNSELKFFEGKQPVTVQISYASPEWPKKWVLLQVKMTNSKIPSRILNVSSDQWKQNGRDLSMNW